MSNKSTAIRIQAEDERSARLDRPFFFVLLLLLLDYGRPQAFFPFVEVLHPGWFIQSALFFYLVSRRLIDFRFAQTKYFVLLLLLMVIHVPIAVNNYWAFKYLTVTFLYFIAFLSIANFVNSYTKLLKFIDSWIIVNTVCAIVGIVHGGRIPRSGFAGDENDFALVMAMAIPFAYFMFFQTSHFKKRLLYLCAAGVFVAANVASFSRGGFIALAAVGIFCWLKSPRKILSTIVVAGIVSVWIVSVTPTYLDEITTIKDENIESGTGQARWYSWGAGWRMFLDHPILGVGQGNFPWNFKSYEPPEGLRGRLHGGRAAHSLYFTLIPELGVVGTMLFVALAYRSWRDMTVFLRGNKAHRIFRYQSVPEKEMREKLNKLKYVVLGIQGALVGYFVAGGFLSVLYYPHFWILMAFSIATIHVGKGLQNLSDPQQNRRVN